MTNIPLRIYIPEETARLLKAIAGLQDTSVNSIVKEAIELWLSQDAIERLKQRHRLDQIAEDKVTDE